MQRIGDVMLSHRGHGTGWQCVLIREGVELRNHHSEPYLLCTAAPALWHDGWTDVQLRQLDSCSTAVTTVN